MINNFLNIWKNNNRLTYVLDKESKYKIKTRYELIYKNKIKNVFLYFDSWEQFKKLYDNIPNEHKHFYEIMEDDCKFFIDFDAKKDEIGEGEWYNFINETKNILKKLFYNLFLEDIKFAEYESFGTEYEKKYSYHIIVEDFNFSILECKLLCGLLLKDINSKYKFIIDPNVYGKWRSLRIENSTKIESKRIKLLKYPNKTLNNIYLNGLITNLDNTISVKNIFTNINIENEYMLNYFVKKEIKQINYLDTNFISKKYMYNENDIKIIKERYIEIEYLINKWNYEIFNKNFKENKIFYTKKIIQNMILYKRIIPFNCPICRRIHEKQDSYIYIKNNQLYFHCRRTEKKPLIFAYFNNTINNFKLSS
jgi:hypothetical protein